MTYFQAQMDARHEGRKEGIREGRKEGRKEGFLSALSSLVKKGLLSAKDASEQAGMSEQEFMKVLASQN